jgi:hypothetical protein
MQTGKSQVDYPVEPGNREVKTLTSYPTVPGRSNVRPCGLPCAVG